MALFTCRVCGERKREVNFSTTTRDGMGRCVECYNAYMRRWKKENRKKVMTYQNNRRKRVARQARAYRALAKLGEVPPVK